jgi:sugar phosphate isomerase/epimerase
VDRLPASPRPEQRVVLASSTLKHLPILDQITAASRAGFDGIGLSATAYRAARRDGVRLGDIDRHLVRSGLVVDEVDALVGWVDGDRDSERARADLPLLLELIEAFTPRRMQVVPPWDASIETTLTAFRQLCDLGQAYSVQIALEFLPETSIPDARTAVALANASGRSNASVCFDVWHHFRGANDLQQILDIPRDRLAAIQVNDGPAQPLRSDYREETRTSRLAPGDGEFPLVELLAQMWSAGLRAPVSVEVMSGAYPDRDPDQTALRLRRQTDRVLNEAAGRLVAEFGPT